MGTAAATVSDTAGRAAASTADTSTATVSAAITATRAAGRAAVGVEQFQVVADGHPQHVPDVVGLVGRQRQPADVQGGNVNAAGHGRRVYPRSPPGAARVNPGGGGG